MPAPEVMRVLMLTQYPYCAEDERLGGIMQASYRLVCGLDALHEPRLQLHVVTHSVHVQSLISRTISDRTTVYYYPWRRGVLDALLRGYPAAKSALAEASAKIRPDVIHAQGTANYILATTRSGLPHVVTVHGIFRNEMKVVRSDLTLIGHIASRIKIGLEGSYAKRIRNLIAITDEVAAFVKERSPGVRIFSIPNTIDEQFFRIPSLEPDARPTILFIAAITYRKGLDYLLAAFAKLSGALPAAKLRIAGIWDWDPSYVKALREQYDALVEDGRVTFLGGIDQAQLVKEMTNAMTLCLPSRAESAPMVISQAMAAGRPVVASKVGGIPGMVDHAETGLLWDVGDVDTLADLLKTVLSDIDRARRMGEAARTVAKARHSARSVAARTLEAYLEIVRTRR